MGREPDCLACHASIPGSNPTVPVWGFQRNSFVSPFGNHVNCRVKVETMVYRRNFAQGFALRASHTIS